uniref:Cytochrome P450 n=1 Tax=Anopheles dirus TaxID=7168 RepID=A0A2Y9D1G1_9DIPT
MYSIVWLAVITVVLCAFYIRKRFAYWADLGVQFVPSRFPLGNIQHTSHLMVDLYQQLKSSKHRFGGIFQFTDPVALITHPELVKHVLVRDFRHFHDRCGYYNAEHDPLSGHMLNREGDRWTLLRRSVSPIFSSGRLKTFCPEMVQMMTRFCEYLDTKLDTEGDKIELKEMISRFNTDIAARFLMGMEGSNLTDPDGGLHAKIIREAFMLPNVWQQFLMTSHPSLAKKMRLTLYSKSLTEVLQQTVQTAINFRKQNSNPCRRNDLIDQLLKVPGAEGKTPLTLAEIAAEVFLFFGAYDAAGVTIFYCLFELALQPDLQDRARQCVLAALGKHGEMTYEALNDMPYIDQCLNETLRKYPLAINSTRVVTDDYPVPDAPGGIVLPKGLHVIVPVYAIHHDPEYYPDPERYDPERFAADACERRTPSTFLPFGMGPKSCVGYRLAKIQLRAMMGTLLRCYEFSSCSETKDSRSEVHSVIKLDGGLWLKVKRIERKEEA